jgi:hypothetical protein
MAPAWAGYRAAGSAVSLSTPTTTTGPRKLNSKPKDRATRVAAWLTGFPAAAAWAARRQPQPPSPPVYGFSDRVGLDRLDVGVIAERELSRRGQLLHETVVPCCGRPVTLRLEDREDTTRAVCCRCVPCQADVSKCAKGRSVV